MIRDDSQDFCLPLRHEVDGYAFSVVGVAPNGGGLKQLTFLCYSVGALRVQIHTKVVSGACVLRGAEVLCCVELLVALSCLQS